MFSSNVQIRCITVKHLFWYYNFICGILVLVHISDSFYKRKTVEGQNLKQVRTKRLLLFKVIRDTSTALEFMKRWLKTNSKPNPTHIQSISGYESRPSPIQVIM